MSDRIEERRLEAYVDLVLAGAGDEAMAAALALADAGTPIAVMLTGLVGASQARVGFAWESGQVTVAQEHAATTINDRVLRALAQRITQGGKGPVALACVQHNWHSLPAAILEQLLRLQGWRVDFLGASLAPHALVSEARDHDYTALALSCMLASHLWEAARVIDAAHAAGIRVLVGGAAFGSDHRRADVLGADGWAASADAADVILTRWQADPQASPRPYARPWNQESGALRAQQTSILTAALASAASDPAAITGDDQQFVAVSEQEFDRLLHALTAALICGDDRVLFDDVAWMQEVLTLQQHASAVLVPRLRALLGALEPSLSDARRALAAAIDRLHSGDAACAARDPAPAKATHRTARLHEAGQA